MTKAYAHAIKRAFDHYGVQMTEGDIASIVAMVSKRGSVYRPDISLSNGAEAHEVTIRNRAFLVVVNKVRGRYSIGTFYPEYRLGNKRGLRDTARIIRRGDSK